MDDRSDFAKSAMQGLLAGGMASAVAGNADEAFETIAKVSFGIADAMLAVSKDPQLFQRPQSSMPDSAGGVPSPKGQVWGGIAPEKWGAKLPTDSPK